MSRFSSGLSRRDLLQSASAAWLVAAFSGPASAEGLVFPKGAVIRTLFRDYSPEEITGGATLFHEHLSYGPDLLERFFAGLNEVRRVEGLPPIPPEAVPPRDPLDPMRDVNRMAEELRRAQREGVACIVDASMEGMGMDLAFIRKAARLSGLPIVKGAGFHSQPFYPEKLAKLSEEQIFQVILQQADQYPAGALGEIGSWDEINPTERRVFRAVGKVHLATNLPIFTHTGIPGKAAIEQLDLLEDAGVDPRRVAIGHLGNLVDPQLYVHKTLCRRGAYIGFDRQGGMGPGGDDGDKAVVPMIMGLIESGFTDQILVSGDAGRDYARPVTKFVPMLKAAGASDEVLRRIMVDNPRRFLAFVPKRPRPKA